MTTNPPARLSRSTRRQLVLFAAVCLAISWGFWLAVWISGGNATESPTIWLFAIGASGPSLAALVAVIVLRVDNPPRTRIAPPVLWLPLALVLGALPAVVAELALAPGSFGADAGSIVAGSGGIALFVITYLIAGPLAEEFGWRGYLQPRVRLRFGIIGTAVIVGAAWAVWHVPLFLLNGTGQHAMGIVSVNALLFFVGLVPASLTYLFLSERLRGGVWSAIAIHFAGNAALSLLPQPSLTGAVIQFGVTVAVAVAVFLAWRVADRRSGGANPI